MFTLSADTPLRAFCISSRFVRPSLVWPEGLAVDFYDPIVAGDAPFCLAMNRGNCIAYDGSDQPAAAAAAFGMPLWVFLDCCTLPSAMVGFAAPRESLPEDLARRLDPDGTLAWLGISEYMGLPSLEPGTVVGVSLFSLGRGLHLGTRSKALGLFALRAQRQVGVAQYANPSVRLHLAFGDLELLAPRAPVHSRPEETFVYTAPVPDPGRLAAMVGGRALERKARAPLAITHAFDPRQKQEVDAFVARSGRFAIVGTGSVEEGALTQLSVATLETEAAPEVPASPAAPATATGGAVARGAAASKPPLLIVGCGYSGEAIAETALREGRVVWGTTRDAAKALRLSALGIEPVLVDFERDADLPELPTTTGWDVVISLAPEPTQRPHGVLERALAWLGERPVRKLVYLSATSIFGGGNGDWVDDATVPAPTTARGKLRLEAEQLIAGWGEAHGVETLSLRLPGIYGPNRTTLPRLRDGSYRLYNAELWSNRIFVDDIASAALFGLATEGLTGSVIACDLTPSPITEVVAFSCAQHGLPTPPHAPMQDCPPSVRDFWQGSKRCKASTLLGLGWTPAFPSYREGLLEAWRLEEAATLPRL
ncbi:MAG: NAD-dependent epimerase/dehydratase family protein [Deltaproteobacteria bacterium]|nr:NAD-dependent epimerase/dehydratase family protein [Deltaproteobacteria bacterium]